MAEYYTIKNKDILEKCIIHLRALNPNKIWDIQIKHHVAKRSNPQNKIYWKWISIIGNELGYHREEMHEEFATRFIGTVEKTTLSGSKLIEPVSTTTLTTKEFAEYLVKIEAFAMGENIRLPSPEHYGWDDER